MDRTIVEIYRDCLRLAKYLRDKTGNKFISGHVRSEFQKHKLETDPEKIEELKKNAKERNRIQAQEQMQPTFKTKPKTKYEDNINVQ